MRQIANIEGNDMMKFISYSHVNPKVAGDEVSKLSQGSGSPKNRFSPASLK